MNFGELPSGTWVHLKDLPVGTSKEELAAWFYESGLVIPAENISCHDHMNSTTAIISFTRPVIADTLNWILNGRKFDDRIPVAKSLWEQDEHSARVKVRARNA